MFIRSCHGCGTLKEVKKNFGSVWCFSCIQKKAEIQLEKRKDYYKKRKLMLAKLREEYEQKDSTLRKSPFDPLS